MSDGTDACSPGPCYISREKVKRSMRYGLRQCRYCDAYWHAVPSMFGGWTWDRFVPKEGHR